MEMSEREKARATVIQDLLDGMEDLLLTNFVIPDDQRWRRWSCDAEKITGQLGRMLGTARDRLPLPPPAESEVTASERSR